MSRDKTLKKRTSTSVIPMGDLTLLYAASDIALVGGSMIPHGGHNVLEPCALGVPVIFGPHMFNFRGISQLASGKGGWSTGRK